MRRRDVLAMGLAALSAPLGSGAPARAQGKFPERPIRLIVPYAPGGVFDAVGRPWAERMKTGLGTVVVENIGGAGGALGAAAVARAQPDGYTLLLGGGGAIVINPIASRTPYDPIKDFDPVAILVVTGLALVVHPAVPAQSLAELIAYAKASPGKLSYGSAGVGTVNHLAGELFKSLTGVADIVHIPYKGAGPAVTDTISGQIPMVVANITGQIIALHRAGKLRILAVTSPKRLAAAPDIPTAVEAGVPGMVSQNFIGLFAPARTPQPIVEQIAHATRAAMADQDYQKMLLASGFEAELDSTPDKARRFVDEDIGRWTPIIKSIGLKLD